MATPHAVIIGVGSGLSASLARLFAKEGYGLTLGARDVGKLKDLAAETGAKCMPCDAADADSIDALVQSSGGPLRVAIYNPSYRQRGAIVDLERDEVQKALQVTAFGAFLFAQQAAKAMMAQDAEGGIRGTILFTGASAGVKGFPRSAPFAMGKFAQRGLAQSMARELHPHGIHVAWINIDGGIRNPYRPEPPGKPDSMLDPDEVARAYLGLVKQHRSAWSNELSIRPWTESF